MSLPPDPAADQPLVLLQLKARGAEYLPQIPADARVILATSAPIAVDTPTRLERRTIHGIEERLITGGEYAPWPGYLFVVVGQQRTHEPSPDNPWFGWGAWSTEDTFEGVEAWYLAAAAVDGAFYAEIVAVPGRPVRKAIRELRPIWHTETWPAHELQRAGEAMRLLHVLQRPSPHAGGGAGSTVPIRATSSVSMSARLSAKSSRMTSGPALPIRTSARRWGGTGEPSRTIAGSSQ
jgi:hypothetical protein